MRILFVENHRVFARFATEQMLSEHDVALVGSLSAARRALHDWRFDAVLVDYDLDDGKGDALVRDLREARFPGRIVAVSSHEERNARLVAAGAHASCPKTQFARIGAHLVAR